MAHFIEIWDMRIPVSLYILALATLFSGAFGCMTQPVVCTDALNRCQNHEAAVIRALGEIPDIHRFPKEQWIQLLTPVLAPRGLQVEHSPSTHCMEWSPAGEEDTRTSKVQTLITFTPEAAPQCVQAQTSKGLEYVFERAKTEPQVLWICPKGAPTGEFSIQMTTFGCPPSSS